jgi:peptidoglycan-associated lipoprotein
MKQTQSARLLILGLTLSLAATGCHHNPQYVKPITSATTGGPEDIGPGKAIEDKGIQGNPTGEPMSHPLTSNMVGWVEHPDILEAQTVYFDADSSTIKVSEKPKLSAVADYLKANSANGVRVQGHCDERGTEEYNRALGERRALALREELIALGIAADHVDTVSFGKDKPADPGHTEAGWSKNRRGVFVVLTQPGNLAKGDSPSARN